MNKLVLAGAVGLLLCGCGGTRVTEQWRPPILVPGGQAVAPVLPVLFDRFDGFSDDGEAEKARRAVMGIAAVLNSKEFRCRVLSFNQAHPLDAQHPGTRCLNDPTRRDQLGDYRGFFWGSSPGSPDSIREYGIPMSNQAVYDRIMAAMEPRYPAERAGVAHVTCGLRSSFWHPNSIGATDPMGTTRTNSGWFARVTTAELSGHWAHEFMHVLGFTHAGCRCTGRSASVPYAVGLIACQMSRELFPESYDAAGRDNCISTMQGL